MALITALTSALVKPAFLALATKLPDGTFQQIVNPLSLLHFAGHFKTVSGSTVIGSGFTTRHFPCEALQFAVRG